ncbi:MAG: metallophosphoesterase [Kofleriaceae bacterium]|nr:metallophosphoesterase [Myxococcales bacterium]MCB9564404.1 metallophosphoesterase [Kofleriaceae bacterium]
MKTPSAIPFGAILLIAAAACGSDHATDPDASSLGDGATAPDAGDPGADAAPPAEVVLVGAGDIAGSGPGAEITAALIRGIPGTVFTLGDNAYSSGTAAEFMTRFDPTWGTFKDRILFPTAGNHDYVTADASAYFAYFGAAAGDPTKGYYSADLGAWHVVVLNSNCSEVGGCNAGSPQEQWLRADLAAHPNVCTVAMWHHPLWNIGQHGDAGQMYPMMQALYAGGVDVVLAGHDHDYQRWTPMTPDGVPDPIRGVREFVVGTGGVGFYDFARSDPHVEVQDNQTYGVLELTLRATDYDWQFVPEPGATFTDSGTGTCHGGTTP